MWPNQPNGHIFYSIPLYMVLKGRLFPFIHNGKDNAPPIDACCYGGIDWYLAQGKQQYSPRLYQSSMSMRGCKTRSKASFWLMFKNSICHDSSGRPLYLICLKVSVFSLGAILSYSIILNG